MRLTSNMLNVLKTLHNAENKCGVASLKTAFALSDRDLDSISDNGFPARTGGLAFPELSVELTEKGRIFCNQQFNLASDSSSKAL